MAESGVGASGITSMDEGANNADNQQQRDNDNAQLQPKRSNKKRSAAWLHFTEIPCEDPNARRKASCNWCGTIHCCDSKANGTGTMLYHLSDECKKYPLRNVDKTQTTLGFKPKQEGDNTGGGLVAVPFSVEACRQALAEMLILDELPFRFVEGEGFRRLMFVTQPKWTKIPSRVTVAKDCYDVYLREKKKLKKSLKGQRVCLTTDTWTSLQNLSYMCLTAHYIDDDWVLHKKILNFGVVENHKGETLGKVIEMCLLEWNIELILTLTVDNASSNNEVIKFLKRKTKHWKGTILQHEFLHMRCCAHILNLIVRDGLKDMDDSIVRVRNSIRYVRSSPERMKTFKKCVEKEKITFNFLPCLDVPTRWNYTFKMLDRAEKFQQAFERLLEDDLSFRSALKEVGCDENDVARGPPDDYDWDKCRLFVKFLKLFYDATLNFSGTQYITCNSFVMELNFIQESIDLECQDGEEYLKLMAINMKKKLEKYWANFDNMNMLLYVGCILDPRYKMKYFEFNFPRMFDEVKAKDVEIRVLRALNRLFEEYKKNEVGSKTQNAQGSTSIEQSGSEKIDLKALRMSQFDAHIKEAGSIEKKSEVDRYLNEVCEARVKGFDVLAWWKSNFKRFPVLSKLARHVLASPVSTVASESAFSTAGRVLNSFRSSLLPRTVEALICAQNWLRSPSTPINLKDAMNDIEEFEKLELELLGEQEPQPTLIED